MQLEVDVGGGWDKLVGDRLVWGPGFSGWDHARTVDENLRERIAEVDAVFVSEAFVSRGEPGYLAPPSARVLGERPCIAYLRDVTHTDVEHIDVVLYAYAQSELDDHLAAQQLARRDDPAHRRARQLFRHVPATVRTDLFFSNGDDARDLDVVLVGRTHAATYPLRARWEKLVRRGRWKNALQLDVPFGRAWRFSDEERASAQVELAAVLRRARIVLLCSGVARRFNGKLVEAAASGAFVISDVPAQVPSDFVEHMGCVSGDFMTDDELVEVVDGWLARDEERRAHAACLMEVARRFDTTRFWSAADAAVHAWRR